MPSEEVTETMELLSTITSHAVCLKGESSCQTYSVTEKHTHAHWRPSEQLELVYAAIERLEQSIVTQHASNQFSEYPFIIVDEVITLKLWAYLVLQHPQSGSGNNRSKSGY
jgi:hypothetical protein